MGDRVWTSTGWKILEGLQESISASREVGMGQEVNQTKICAPYAFSLG
jgi:hypothetical protein